jgi:G3E family GTPase
MPVAETFTFKDENGVSLSDIARIDSMVTLVDAPNFLRDYCSEPPFSPSQTGSPVYSPP